MTDDSNVLGKTLKQHRTMIPLTLTKLGAGAGVSASHLSRIERGQRFPSAFVLRKLAKLLGLDETEMFILAGFLSPHSSNTNGESPVRSSQLNPYVAKVLSQEPINVQRTAAAVLSILKSLAVGIRDYEDQNQYHSARADTFRRFRFLPRQPRRQQENQNPKVPSVFRSWRR